ncbi:MAG TPA: 50S ribosomal protein L29 [Syntrophorhabdaceae bacterium]|nr:50S ribosomal protein L29 [Syntrophorhabdaceae bacterium]HPU30300.1 50S ribosomal protein L29 [Syntrophorhabdaceae bacterium]
MKAKELRELTKEELLRKKTDIKEELFNLRFQHSTGQLENTARMKLLKRDIARIETVLREKESKR